MGISDEGIIIICIVGASALVTIGYAIHRIFAKVDYGENKFTPPDSQQQYMREVRERNMLEAFGDCGQQRHFRMDK